MRDLVRESSRKLLEEFEDPSDLLERPTGKNSTVQGSYPALTINHAAAQVDGPEIFYIKLSRNDSILHMPRVLKVKSTRRN